MKNQQEYFDWVVNHFNSENRGYSTVKKCCTYRDKCAIGYWMTPDSTIAADNANLVLNSLFEQHKELFPEWMWGFDIGFLNALQSLHDPSTYWDKDGLTDAGIHYARTIAFRFNLTFNYNKNEPGN